MEESNRCNGCGNLLSRTLLLQPNDIPGQRCLQFRFSEHSGGHVHGQEISGPRRNSFEVNVCHDPSAVYPFHVSVLLLNIFSEEISSHNDGIPLLIADAAEKVSIFTTRRPTGLWVSERSPGEERESHIMPKTSTSSTDPVSGATMLFYDVYLVCK